MYSNRLAGISCNVNVSCARFIFIFASFFLISFGNPFSRVFISLCMKYKRGAAKSNTLQQSSNQMNGTWLNKKSGYVIEKTIVVGLLKTEVRKWKTINLRKVNMKNEDNLSPKCLNV